MRSPHTTPAWTIRPEDVADHELEKDNTSSFSWKQAIEAGLACARHPAEDRDRPSCTNDKCVICHKYRQENRPKNDVGGWIWSKHDVAEILNSVLPQLCEEARYQPIWTTSRGAYYKDCRQRMPQAIARLEAARGRNKLAWQRLTHIAVNTWTLEKVKSKSQLRPNTTVKLGRLSGIDAPENWYFMVGEDPGIDFYYELYTRVVCRPPDGFYGEERIADTLEGLFGLYHGLKRLRRGKVHTISS